MFRFDLSHCRCFGSRLFAKQAKSHEKHETLSRLSLTFVSFVVQTFHRPNLFPRQPIQLAHQRVNLRSG